MRALFLIALILPAAAAATPCKEEMSESKAEETVREAVATPSGLKDAVITVKTKAGKEYTFSANEYMVASRVKLRNKAVVTRNRVLTCKQPAKQNEVLVGLRRDYTGLDKASSGSAASVQSNKGPVLDIQYIRQEAIGSVNLGVGIDTNGTPKVLFGGGF